MDSIWAASPATALVVAVLMQGLKRWNAFPWLSRDTERLNHYVGLAVATLTGLGLAFTFEWNEDTGQFAAGMSGNAYDLFRIVLQVPVQWAQQHGFYKVLVSLPESAGESRNLQRQMLEALLKIGEGRAPTTGELVQAVEQPKPPLHLDVNGRPIEE
jgi:hypothetical protein